MHALDAVTDVVDCGPIRIVIADDHEWVRNGFRTVLHHPPELSVIGLASNAIETHRLVQLTRPDVLVLDHAFGDDNGLELAERLKTIYPPARIILVTAWEDVGTWHRSMQLGLGGFLLKKVDDSWLRRAVGEVARGRRFFPEFYTEPSAVQGRPRWCDLSQTEWAVLRALSEADTPKQAASLMGHGYSPKTVSNHLQAIYRKLGRNGFRVVTDLYRNGGWKHDPARVPSAG